VQLTYRASRVVDFHELGSDFRWVDVKNFELKKTRSHRDMLAVLIANPWYDDDYASPSGALPSPAPNVHGPYRLDAITADSFEEVGTRNCSASLTAWGDQHGALPADFAAKFTQVVQSLLVGSAAVFRLRDLGPDALHRRNDHLGALGFLEYVIVSKNTNSVSLLVASDD
jgi:hypothetical protein